MKHSSLNNTNNTHPIPQTPTEDFSEKICWVITAGVVPLGIGLQTTAITSSWSSVWDGGALVLASAAGMAATWVAKWGLNKTLNVIHCCVKCCTQCCSNNQSATKMENFLNKIKPGATIIYNTARVGFITWYVSKWAWEMDSEPNFENDKDIKNGYYPFGEEHDQTLFVEEKIAEAVGLYLVAELPKIAHFIKLGFTQKNNTNHYQPLADDNIATEMNDLEQQTNSEKTPTTQQH